MNNPNYGGFLTKSIKSDVEDYIEYSKKINPWLSARDQNYKKSFAEFIYIVNSRTRATKADTIKEDNRNLSLRKLLEETNAELTDVSEELLKIEENFKHKNMYIKSVRQILDSLDISIVKQCSFSAGNFYGLSRLQLLSPPVLRLIIAVKEEQDANAISLRGIILKNKDVFFKLKLSGEKPRSTPAERFIEKISTRKNRRNANEESFMSKRSLKKFDSFERIFALKIPLTFFKEHPNDK